VLSFRLFARRHTLALHADQRLLGIGIVLRHAAHLPISGAQMREERGRPRS
jgi:hypothetical protein